VAAQERVGNALRLLRESLAQHRAQRGPTPRKFTCTDRLRAECAKL